MNRNSNSFQTARQERWTVRENRRRNAWRWEIINLRHDVIAVVYGGRDDAELMASTSQQRAAAQELRACTKRLATILGGFQDRLAPSELMALNRARELVLRRSDVSSGLPACLPTPTGLPQTDRKEVESWQHRC